MLGLHIGAFTSDTLNINASDVIECGVHVQICGITTTATLSGKVVLIGLFLIFRHPLFDDKTECHNLSERCMKSLVQLQLASVKKSMNGLLPNIG